MSRASEVLGAICIAAVILARAGVLVCRGATALASELESLSARHALARHREVVIDGKLVTGSGPSYARPPAAARLPGFLSCRARVRGLKGRGLTAEPATPTHGE